MFPCAVSDLVGEALDIVAAAPRVDLLADMGFLLDIDLGVAGDTRGEVRRKGDSLIEGVGVETLGVAENGTHGLYAGTAHVVEGILLGKRPA